MVRNGYNSLVLFSIVLVISQSLAALNTDKLKNADAYFDKRGNSVENVNQGRSLYLKIIKDKHETNAVRLSALARYGHLTVFLGEVAKDRFGVKDAAKIFRDCIETTDYLSPKSLGENTAEYTYWRAMCIGLWAANTKKADVLFHIGRIGEMKALITLGVNQYREFDGYGFNRMLAGVLVRSKALAVLNLYDPKKALALLDESFKEGCDNYMNYILKAEAFEALEDQAGARGALESGIDELKEKIEKRMIPSHLVEENYIFLMKMYEMLEQLS